MAMPNWDLMETPLDNFESEESEAENVGQENFSESEQESTKQAKKQKRQSKFDKKPAPEEKQAILSYFDDIIKAHEKAPNMRKCQSYIKSYNSSLDWLQVKYIVSNRIEAKKRKENKEETAGKERKEKKIKEKRVRKRKVTEETNEKFDAVKKSKV